MFIVAFAKAAEIWRAIMADRFQREVEDVGETAPDPVNVTGVPEPEEWLLLALAAALLAWYAYTRRRKQLAISN